MSACGQLECRPCSTLITGNALGRGHGAAAKFRAGCAWSLQLCFFAICQLALYVHRDDWAAVFASRTEHAAFRAARDVYPVLALILFW